MRHRYLYLPDDSPSPTITKSSDTSLEDFTAGEADRPKFQRLARRAARRAARQAAEPYVVPTTDTPPFTYGPTHDLEALWWVSLYFLYARTVVEDSVGTTDDAAATAEQLKRQCRAARLLLCDLHKRWDTMVWQGCFKDEIKNLQPRLREWGADLEEVRVHLVKRYRYIEEDVMSRAWLITAKIYYACAEVWGGMSFDMKEDGVYVQTLGIFG